MGLRFQDYGLGKLPDSGLRAAGLRMWGLGNGAWLSEFSGARQRKLKKERKKKTQTERERERE